MTAPRALPRALLVLPALLVTACVAAPGAAPTPVALSSPVTSAPADGPGNRPTTSADDATGAGEGTDEVVVGDLFRRYYALLLDRDFAAACALHAPETTAMLLERARVRGLPAGTCEQALTRVYALSGVAGPADVVARTAELREVTVTGDTAAVTWVGEVTGERRTIVSGMRRVDGGWKVADGP